MIGLKQNTSHAVMGQRNEANDSLDDFPTPPWATRALLEHVIQGSGAPHQQTCLELACGAGHMVKVLSEYLGPVIGADIHGYGYAAVGDFLGIRYPRGSFDWMVTDPPFCLAEQFMLHSLPRPCEIFVATDSGSAQDAVVSAS